MSRRALIQTWNWLSLFSTIASITTQVLGTRADDWPRYGHDARLTGHSSLHGKITKPQTLWSCSTAGSELQLEIVPAEGEQRARFEPNASVPAQTFRKVPWPGPPALDLDGSGLLRPAFETYHERWARVLPNVKGWQRVAWNQTWTDQKVCRLQLFAYDQGFDKPRLVWQSDPPEDTIFQPLDIVYDLDGDGTAEICVAAHYRVMIFEGTTGRKETELRYHHSRPYGWFGLADVDGDGRMELITIGDFQSHIDVLNFDPKKPEAERLSVRWRRDIEQNIEERSKWPQVGPHPLADVDADGRPEIIFNLFNDTGDYQWHAMVLNASNGQPMADFPRRFVHGTTELDGHGKARLFLAETDGVLVPAYGTIELVGWKDAGPRVEWSLSNAAWVCADLPQMGPTWSTSAAQGMRRVLLGDGTKERSPAFLVAQRAPKAQPPFPTTLKAMRLSSQGVPEMLWQVSELIGDWEALAFSAIDQTGGLGALLRLRLPSDTALSLVCQGAEPRVVDRHPLGVTVSTPIAARLQPNGPMTVLVEGAAQTVFALQSPKPGRSSPKVLWQRPGRGMGDGGRWLGPVAADLQNDGGNEVIVASQDASGRALLVAYRHDGSVFWQTRFDQTPGAVPVWNSAALTFWWPGAFRALGQTDLFVNTRRGLMHSDVGQLLDGRSGALLWRQEKASIAGQFNWGYAGVPPAVADLDADGRDELVSLYPVCFWVADGRTGRLTRGVELASRKRLPAWAAYGEPMVHAFGNSNQPEVLLDSPYILALLDTNGTPIWHGLGRADYPTAANEGNVGQTTTVKHALADFTGEGDWVIASAGYADGVRVIDPRDGHVVWSLSAPAPTCPRVVTADIDGRKGDELLYVAGTKLIAITGARSAGRILWEWQGPAALSMPAIADVDGDGLAEIVVQAADGSVHCIGPAP